MAGPQFATPKPVSPSRPRRRLTVEQANRALPLVGRIAGIVDCYDAMTSERFYAKGMSTYDAVRELKRLGKTWF